MVPIPLQARHALHAPLPGAKLLKTQFELVVEDAAHGQAFLLIVAGLLAAGTAFGSSQFLSFS